VEAACGASDGFHLVGVRRRKEPMAAPKTDPKPQDTGKPGPSLREQVVVTIKVLVGTGVVLGSIWLLDLMVAE
jgi:hypothetical protein